MKNLIASLAFIAFVAPAMANQHGSAPAHPETAATEEHGDMEGAEEVASACTSKADCKKAECHDAASCKDTKAKKAHKKH